MSMRTSARTNLGAFCAQLLAGALAVVVLALGGIGSSDALAQSSVRPPGVSMVEMAPGRNPNVRPPQDFSVPPAVDPTGKKGAIYDHEMWRSIRKGIAGDVSIPDKKAGQLIQADGEAWRLLRNGPLMTYGWYALAGIVGVLVLFFLVRGRIRIEHGWSGHLLLRFNGLERTAHWLLAVSFIILGLSGLNMLYGRAVLLPVIGKPAFAGLSAFGKLLHNYVAFAFMVGLALSFLLWIRHNFPNRHDIVWLLKGGGIFTRSHPPARKFNAGQKILFWLVMLGGLSISLSGLAMMFPFQSALFAKTFGVLNGLGAQLPTTLTPLQEMQFATLWHSIMALVLICVIIGHIYIGTVGMEGAFDAMGTGMVDENWAREHHSLWVEEVKASEGEAGNMQRAAPAE
ncbi:MAG: formate dehydrogenase subunit gamma [Hyphomicrobiaceae bacterium]